MQMTKTSIAIQTLGCKVNAIESSAFEDALKGLGFNIVSDPGQAIIAVLNTCSVTGEADSKTRKALRRLAAHDSVKKVIAIGCSAVMHPEYEELAEKITIIKEKDELISYLISLSEIYSSQDNHLEEASINSKNSSRTRAFIKVQDGCENFCTYCIVPYARGASKSLPFTEIYKELEAKVLEGTREAVLSGINIGNYKDVSHDINSLADLVEKLLKTGIERLRISSVEPPDVDEKLIDLLANHPRVAPHVHLPLQSGSDLVLVRMGRKYNTEKFREVVKKLKSAHPKIAITTDLIVGFPSESNEEFQETLDFIKEMGFSKIHVFRYSRRKGTKADEMEGHLGPRIIADRAKQVLETEALLAQKYRDSLKGKTQKVLIERNDGEYLSGVSEYYLRHRLKIKDLELPPSALNVGALIEIVG